jgi:hypothetical protein
MVIEVGDIGKTEHLHCDRTARPDNSIPESSETEPRDPRYALSTSADVLGVA